MRRGLARRPVALFKLTRDLIGGAFAGRHQQYEKFYARPCTVNKLHVCRKDAFADAKLFAEAVLME